MSDIFIGKVGNAHNSFLFDGIFLSCIVIHFDAADLKSPCFVFLDYLWSVNLYFFNVECAFNNVGVTTHIILEVYVFFGSLPHTKHVIFLYIPNVAFG